MATYKVFISQPMRNRTNEEIEEERKRIIKGIKFLMLEQNDLVVLDSFFKDAPHDAKPLWFLGESIKLLSEADIVFFAKGWEEARGCVIEHECCEKYGKHLIELI